MKIKHVFKRILSLIIMSAVMICGFSAMGQSAIGDRLTPETMELVRADIYTNRLKLFTDNHLYNSMLSDPEKFFMSIALDEEYNKNVAWSAKEVLEWLLQADISDIDLQPYIFYEIIILDMLASNAFSDGEINEEAARTTLFRNVCALIFETLDIGIDMKEPIGVIKDALSKVDVKTRNLLRLYRSCTQPILKP